MGYVYTSNIRIPKVTAYLNYAVINESTVEGSLYLSSNPFRDFNSMTEHAYTFWKLVRDDGKVALYNSSVDGPKMKLQNVFVLDTDTKVVTENNLDVSDEDVYKSSIRLNDGSVLRISSTYTGTDKVLMYPASLESIVNPGIEVVTGKLVVHVGETKYLTEVNFEKIVVEGDSPTNTGTLILLIVGKEFIYNYDTIILGKTQTLSAEEKGKYSQVVVVNITTVRITDAI